MLFQEYLSYAIIFLATPDRNVTHDKIYLYLSCLLYLSFKLYKSFQLEYPWISTTQITQLDRETLHISNKNPEHVVSLTFYRFLNDIKTHSDFKLTRTIKIIQPSNKY